MGTIFGSPFDSESPSPANRPLRLEFPNAPSFLVPLDVLGNANQHE